MKFSEWKSNYDKDKKVPLRAISAEDLLSIDEWDKGPKDNVEIPYVPCKHTIPYYSFGHSKKTRKMMNEKTLNEELLPDFLMGLKNGIELSYFDLSEEDRKRTDEEWEEYAPNRCSEFCKNLIKAEGKCNG